MHGGTIRGIRTIGVTVPVDLDEIGPRMCPTQRVGISLIRTRWVRHRCNALPKKTPPISSVSRSNSESRAKLAPIGSCPCIMVGRITIRKRYHTSSHSIIKFHPWDKCQGSESFCSASNRSCTSSSIVGLPRFRLGRNDKTLEY